MTQKRVVYVISHINKSLGFEWVSSGLKKDYKLTFILLNSTSSDLEEFLVNEKVEVKRIPYRGKQDFVSAFARTWFYLLLNRPHIVHAHLFDAQLIGLTAAWLAGVRKRIYTRHNSNFHQVYHPRGVKFDLWSNRMATNIISISQATDQTLLQLEHVPPSKVIRVPHGFELKIFSDVSLDRKKSIQKKWGIPRTNPVVGVIARHIEWKGIQFIIPAFQRFLEENSTAYLILANASGPYHTTLVEMLKVIPADRVKLIPFEEDVAALYSTFDLYVHTPIDPLCEAFGQTYVEALAARVPSIFTLSGIGAEFIVHEQNALVVEFQNTEAIYLALTRLWKDDELRKYLVENGRQDVFSQFRIESMLSSLKEIYGK